MLGFILRKFLCWIQVYVIVKHLSNLMQELLLAGGSAAPKSVHEVIAHLATRLSRWDDRYRTYVTIVL